MNINKILTFWTVSIFTIILSSGCSPSASPGFLAPGLTGSATPQQTPGYQGQATSANYISSQFTLNEPYGRVEDRNFFGKVDFHRANTYQGGSVSYGAFGYLGNLSARDTEMTPASLLGNYFYGGVGLTAGVNAHISYPKLDWELLKINARFYNELGKYPELKNELTDYRNDHDDILPRTCSGFIFPTCHPSSYNDVYSRHGSILDTSVGMGFKIKHKNKRTTQIGTGMNFHLFGRQRNSVRAETTTKTFNTAGLYLQFSHTLQERLSVNVDLLSSGATFGLSYRFGER